MKLYSKSALVRMTDAMQQTDRFVHTYILTGEKGVGKKISAMYLAMQLLCDNKNACGSCRQCRRIASGQHPDVITPEKDGKSHIYTVERVREIVSDSYTAPNDCDRKVYILPDCEGWKDAAQDAMLKITEEPPDSAYFIFTAQNRSFFLPTLISRAMVIDIPEADREQCVRCLTEQGKYEQDKITEAAELFGGNIGKCIAYLDGDEGLLSASEAVKQAADAICSGDEYALLKAISGGKRSRDDMRQIFSMLSRVIRDAGVIRSGGKGLLGSCRELSVKMAERLDNVRIGMIYDALCSASEKCMLNVNTDITGAALCGEIAEAAGF